MGQGYGFNCLQCGNQEDLLEGQGFMLHGLSVKEYLDHPFLKFHPSTHKKIIQLDKKIRGLQIYCAYQGFLCPKCNIPYSKLYVEVYKGNCTYHQSFFRCTHCNHELTEQKIKNNKVYHCPKCLEHALVYNGVDIMWD